MVYQGFHENIVYFTIGFSIVTLISPNLKFCYACSVRYLLSSKINSEPYKTYTFLKVLPQEIMGKIHKNSEKLPRAPKKATDFFVYNISRCGRDLPEPRDLVIKCGESRAMLYSIGFLYND